MINANPWTLKYRPRLFRDVVGQPEAVAQLRGMLKRQELPNAILMSGPFGSGKTTLARLFARYVNCETSNACGKCPSCRAVGHPDISEMDAAEARGIDDVRALLRRVRIKPTHKIRFFILDELHQLTPQASQALLKSLEEPGPTTCYILCTNEPHKLPDTVRSRCQHLALRLPTRDDIMVRLAHIAEQEKLDPQLAKKSMLTTLAEASGGHVRDAVGLLQSAAQQHAGGADIAKITASISTQSGANTINTAVKLLAAMYAGNHKLAVRVIMDFTSLQEPAIPWLNLLLRMNEYGLATVAKADSAVWHTQDNQQYWSVVSEKFNLESALELHRKLLTARERLQMSGAVDRSVLIGTLL